MGIKQKNPTNELKWIDKLNQPINWVRKLNLYHHEAVKVGVLKWSTSSAIIFLSDNYWVVPPKAKHNLQFYAVQCQRQAFIACHVFQIFSSIIVILYWDVLLILLQLCSSKNECVIELTEENFGKNLCPSSTKRLAVEAMCSWNYQFLQRMCIQTTLRTLGLAVLWGDCYSELFTYVSENAAVSSILIIWAVF